MTIRTYFIRPVVLQQIVGESTNPKLSYQQQLTSCLTTNSPTAQQLLQHEPNRHARRRLRASDTRLR